MSAIQRLKKILAWTNMSSVVALSLVVLSGSAPAQSFSNFGFSHREKIQLQKFKKHQRSEAIRRQQINQQRQLACLARNVYYEAGGEPLQGQIAVAQVTVNRARSSQFPSDICAVVSQSAQRGENRVCQFSWYCDDTKNKHLKVKESHPSYIAARKVYVEGETLPRIGHNTYYFHNLTVNIHESYPYKVMARIGNHVFYRREK